MSGYPSLISPLMDEQGLILTEALNQDAQTALALSATNQADIIVLQETALQLTGDPATYTGLPDTNMSLNGDLQMNNNNVTGVDEITSDVVNGNTINVKNVDSTNYYSITGNLAGIQVGANIVCGDNITCNTLNYTTLNPPISGSQNIEDVLANGDNANGRDLIGLNDLKATIVQSTNSSGTSQVKTNNLNVYSDDGSTLKAVINESGNLIPQNYYLFGVQPFDFAITNNKNILTTGTTTTNNLSVKATLADGSSSVGTAGQVLSSTGTATAWVDAPVSATPTLGDVMTAGNTASTELNMDNNDITTVASIGITNGTTNVIQVVSSVNQALEFKITDEDFATLRCDSLNADSGISTGIVDATTVETDTLNIGASLLDNNGFAGFPTQYLKSTGSGVEWNAISIPTLGDVMNQNNIASNNLNMNKQNLYNAITMSLSNYGTTKELQLKMNDSVPETLEINSRSEIGIFTPANVQCNTINGTDINYRPTYDYFVAKNGSDTNPGSILSPFLTIQKAIDVCEAFTDNVPRNINIFYGVYSESLTLSKSRIAFNGSNMGGSRSDTGCSINGSITIDVSSGLSDLNNNNIYFNNLLINGSITDTSSVVHRVAIKDCYLYGESSVLTFNPSADYRLFVDYCYLNNEGNTSNDNLVTCGGSGMVSFTNNQMTSKCRGHVVSITCRVDTFVLNVLTNDNTTFQCRAICKLGSTTDNTVYTLGQNAFVYSSTNVKSSASPYFSCGILMDTPAAKTNFLTVIGNTFAMNGLTNSPINFAITGTLISTSAVYVFYGNNTALSTFLSPYSSQINSTGGFVKNALLAVQ
jgi:hypothetical protein